MLETERHAEAHDLHGMRILVVEDTFMVADMIVNELEEHGCVVVGPASRLDHAASLAAVEALDGALLDINLAGEHSFPVAGALRARGIPFAFLTGYADDQMPLEYRDSPCLTKPFHLTALVRLVASRFGPAG